MKGARFSGQVEIVTIDQGNGRTRVHRLNSRGARDAEVDEQNAARNVEQGSAIRDARVIGGLVEQDGSDRLEGRLVQDLELCPARPRIRWIVGLLPRTEQQ